MNNIILLFEHYLFSYITSYNRYMLGIYMLGRFSVAVRG